MAHAHPRPQQGFSLIEIMVGLAIGLATVVIMLQMLTNAEAAKRVAAGGNDAQINASLALYSLQRDIQASGYGFNAYSILGCTLSYQPTSESAAVQIPLAPTTINPPTSLVPAGDAGTDTLLVLYGTGNGSSEGDALIAASSSGVYQIGTTLSANIGDMLIAQTTNRPSPCNLSVDTVVTIPSSSSLNVSPGVSGLPVGSIVYNLGQSIVMHAYAVRNGSLTMCDYSVYNCGSSAYLSPTVNASVWVPVASNIVAMRAQYGRDTNNLPSTMTGVVSQYDQATPGSSADTTGVTNYCSWARTLAVRLALVARSEAYDKSLPTTASPTWIGSTVSTNNPTAVTFDLTQGGTVPSSVWQGYRYKTVQTSVPLRNAIWQGSQATYQGGSGC